MSTENEERTVVVPKSAAEIQRLKLEKLMKKIVSYQVQLTVDELRTVQ